jgi:hypothetical protein
MKRKIVLLFLACIITIAKLFAQGQNNNWLWLQLSFVRIFLFFWLYLILNSFFATDFSASFQAAFSFVRFFLFALAIGFYAFKEVSFNKIIKTWFVIILLFCFDIQNRSIFFLYFICAVKYWD